MQFRGRMLRSAAWLVALAGIAGCGGVGNSPGISGVTSGGGVPAQLVYVAADNASGNADGTVLAFAAGAKGSVAPVATIGLPSGMYVRCVATDSSGNIYAAGDLGTGTAVILIYSAGASGTPTPIRTITFPSALAPTSMAVDSIGELFTLNSIGELLVYSSTANGSALPIRSISGTQTDVSEPHSLTVDTAGNLYVAQFQNSSSQEGILIFAAGANGNVAPVRTINFTLTDNISDVAVDNSGNLYVTDDPDSSIPEILEFAPSASGAAIPTKTITGSATGLYEAFGVEIDGAGNIFVANLSSPSNGSALGIDEFAPTASGNVAPQASMTSTSWPGGGTQIALK